MAILTYGMPEPAYKALGEAIASVMDLAGMTTVALAQQLRDRGHKTDQSLVSKWRNGHKRPPDIDIYPDIEDICGAPKGIIFRRAGYVDDEIDVVAAILADDGLLEEHRRTLIGVYDSFRKLYDESMRSAPSATARDTPPISSQKRAKRVSS